MANQVNPVDACPTDILQLFADHVNDLRLATQLALKGGWKLGNGHDR